MGFDDDLFKITPMSIDINDTRALRPPRWSGMPCATWAKSFRYPKSPCLGISYRQDVGDTRYSGSEIIVRKLAEMGGELVVHDPYVKHWWEFERQDTYPAPGHSWKRFFRNQDDLVDLRVETDLPLPSREWMRWCWRSGTALTWN
jgi:UDP-N-acetyl-D-glucosamine dehydrogenase